MSHGPDLDSIILTESTLASLGACTRFIVDAKQNGLLGKSVNEVRNFILQSGVEDYVNEWNEIVRNRANCDYIQNNLYHDFYKVDKYFVKNPSTGTFDEFDTLEEAVLKQEQNKKDFCCDLHEDCVGDLEDVLYKLKEHFVILEQITTYFGDTIRTVIR